MNLDDLHTFSLVAAHGSFAAAARALGVPKSTVSRRVERLEDALGVALVIRGGRSASLTRSGTQLHAQTAQPLQDITDAERGLTAPEPTGTLRITAPQELGLSTWFSGLLATYHARYPNVVLDVDLTGRIVNLVEEGYDVGLRPASAETPPGVMTRKVGSSLASHLCAAPAYLAAHGTPQKPEQLSAHAGVTHRVLVKRWQLTGPNGEITTEAPRWVVLGTDFAFVEEAIVAGLGIGLLPDFATTAFREGRLVRVLPEWSGAMGGLQLVWPATRYIAPRVRAFLDCVTAEPPVLPSA